MGQELSPEDFRKLQELDGWTNLGQADEAIKCYLSLPEHMRDAMEALSSFTAFLWSRGRLGDCMMFCARAIHLYPTHSLFWLVCSSCLKKLGHTAERKTLLLKAADACPDEAKMLRDIAGE